MRFIVPFAVAMLAQASFALNVAIEKRGGGGGRGGGGRRRQTCEEKAARLESRFCTADETTCADDLALICAIDDQCLERASLR